MPFDAGLGTPVFCEKTRPEKGGKVVDMNGASRGLFLLILLFMLTIPDPSAAWNQSEINWKTLKTDHFEIHYHPGEEWSAAQTALIAEEVYGATTAFYGYEPDSKVHINVFDKSDVSKGATYYYLNRIDISASDIEFHLRGTANWLRNVITHEFLHIVTTQRAMKLPRRIPAVYIQAISFEREKRPDVITGYPNFQGSIPLAGEIVPNWFAEGTSQFMCDAARNDIWDSHRDMILRVAAINDKLLTMDEMCVFGKNSLESEMVYNQGFSMVRFISERFGTEKIAQLVSALSTIYRWSFNGACKEILGISQDELYRMWADDLRAHYNSKVSGIESRSRKGVRVAGKGFMNLFPVGDGSGGSFYLSNMGRDYSDLDLVHVSNDGRQKRIAGGVTSRFSLSSDGRHLCYSRRTGKNRHGYKINDLFVYDLEEDGERRLTHSARATDPSWSPDGGYVACVVNRDGSDRIALTEVDKEKISYLTPGFPGRQYFGLSWGNKGILAARFDGTSRDIVLIDPGSGRESVLISSDADERDPSWDAGGEGFFYSSDRTGIFNIYHRNITGDIDIMVTNVIGGAFSPTPSGTKCLFSAYGKNGYEIRSLPGWREGAFDVDSGNDDLELARTRLKWIASSLSDDLRKSRPTSTDSVGVGGSIGKQLDAGGENFRLGYTSLFLFPRFVIYDGEPRIGLTFDSRDLLDRQALVSSGSIGLNKEFDFFLGFEVRQFKPTLLFEVFRSRKFYSYITNIAGSNIDIYTRYDLWDAFFTCGFELKPTTPTSRKEIALRYNHGEYGLNIEAWELFHEEVGWTYYKGDEVSLLLHYRKIRNEVDTDINPRSGRTVHVELTRAYDRLSSGEFEYRFMPVYGENYYGRYMVTYEEHVPLPYLRHALSLYIKGGALDNPKVDDFFYLYLGGRDGLRGYSYYSMGGSKLAMARLTYRFPVLRNINRQYLNVYFQSIYAAVFAEAGRAWNEDELELRGNKKDVGFEIRLRGFSFYTYPLAVSFEAAYGLNDVEYSDPFYEEMTFYEGNKWKFYGSVFFSF